MPQTRAIKIEHFGYGPDLIGVISEFITLGEMSWAEEDIDIRHKELAELMIKCITLFEEMKEEKE